MFSTVFFVSRFGGSRCRWGQKWSAMRFSTAWLQSRILIRFAAISKLLGGTVFSSEKADSQLSSNQWQRKTVGMTTSIDLLNLERHAQVVLNMMMIIDLHIDERKIQLSENNGDAISFHSFTLWLCWYIPAKPLGAFKFSFETNWLKAFGRFAICKLKSLILYHPHHDEDADDVDDDSYDDIDNAFWQIQSVFFCKRLPSHWSRAGLH